MEIKKNGKYIDLEDLQLVIEGKRKKPSLITHETLNKLDLKCNHHCPIVFSRHTILPFLAREENKVIMEKSRYNSQPIFLMII